MPPTVQRVSARTIKTAGSADDGSGRLKKITYIEISVILMTILLLSHLFYLTNKRAFTKMLNLHGIQLFLQIFILEDEIGDAFCRSFLIFNLLMTVGSLQKSCIPVSKSDSCNLLCC